MNGNADDTEFRKLVERLHRVETELSVLTGEKDRLRKEILHLMAEGGADAKSVVVEDLCYHVKRTRSTSVKYNEAVLRERLGERFTRILDIDAKKLRRNRGVVLEALGERLAEVGSISKARVKAAIESGGVSSEEFAGAFEKSVRDSLRVSKGAATLSGSGPATPF